MKLFTEYQSEHRGNLPYLNESDNQKIDEALALFECECEGKLENMDEGFLGKLLGGVGGFLIGPATGQLIQYQAGKLQGITANSSRSVRLGRRIITTVI